jgi:hypothetical protein
MLPLVKIANLFGFTSGFTLSEDFKSASLKSSAQQLNIPSQPEIAGVLSAISSRDSFHVYLKIDGTEPVSFHSQNTASIQQSLDDLRTQYRIANESSAGSHKFELEANVDKTIADDRLTVICIETFKTHLISLPLKTLLMDFTELLKIRNAVHFVCSQPIAEFNSEYIYFENEPAVSQFRPSSRNRSVLFTKRNDVCHFENAAEISSIPEDFYLQNRSKDETINALFLKLCATTCLTLIADISQFEDDNTFFYKINGIKPIIGKFRLTEIPPEAGEIFFKIYQWIYDAGVVADKIGLARNLLTLHARNKNILNLDSDVFASILSGYQIYLKENITQYIELRSKLIEYVGELSVKVAKLGEDLGNSLSKNFLAFISFFLTVVVLKCNYR